MANDPTRHRSTRSSPTCSMWAWHFSGLAMSMTVAPQRPQAHHIAEHGASEHFLQPLRRGKNLPDSAP